MSLNYQIFFPVNDLERAIWFNLGNIASLKPTPVTLIIKVFSCLFWHFIIPSKFSHIIHIYFLDNFSVCGKEVLPCCYTISSNNYLSSRPRQVSDTIISFFPIDKFDLNLGIGRPYNSSSNLRNNSCWFFKCFICLF